MKPPGSQPDRRENRVKVSDWTTALFDVETGRRRVTVHAARGEATVIGRAPAAEWDGSAADLDGLIALACEEVITKMRPLGTKRPILSVIQEWQAH